MENKQAPDGANTKEEEEQKVKDDELDALLEDALADFKKAPPSTAQSDDTCQSNSNTINDPLFEAVWNEDAFLKMTGGMNEVLEQIAKEDPSLMAEFQKFQQDTPEFIASDLKESVDIEQNLYQTINELTKNMKGLRSDGDGVEDFLKQIQGEMNENGGDGFMGMMEGMMKSLLSKDLLYPSLIEIRDRYPDWLVTNEEKLPPEEFLKYKKQETIVRKLCELFEEEEETDSEDVKRKRLDQIMAHVQQMQEYGQPPDSMMANISGVLGEQATPPVPECCVM